MIVRIISGLILVAISLALIVPGGFISWAGCFAISLMGLFELYRVEKIHNRLAGFVGYLGAITYYMILFVQGDFAGDSVTILPFLLNLIALMAVYVFTYPKYSTEQIAAAFLGEVYVAVSLSFVYLTRILPNGRYLVWLIFLAAWGADTCAYAVGMLIGKHKMAPILSPKKSIEGAVGGVLGATGLGAIYGTVFAAQLPANGRNPALECAIVCFFGAFISIVGDLAASAIKRDHGVKDYSKLIPGHGGIMDRYDSMIFVAPVIYFVICILSQGISLL